ncbi:reverse transcriptase domain-containing protein [Tanacetum coccineum]
MYDDMTYSLLVKMVVKEFNLDPNDRLSLSVKLTSLHLDITDDEDVKNFVGCASNSTDDGIPNLYVGQPTRTQPRIIPGPAGILQRAMLRKNADVIEVGHENVMPTQEYVRKISEDVSEDDHFTLGPWVSAIVYLHGEGVIPSGCLGDMKKYCKNRKLELVVGVVMSCTPNSLGDMTVTLKDPTGVMGGTIHYKVFQKDDGYTNSIKVGSVLILRNVSVFTPKPSKHYLNITIRNIVKVGEVVFKDNIVFLNGTAVEMIAVVVAVECVGRFLFQDHDFLRCWEGKIDNTNRFKHNNGVWVDMDPNLDKVRCSWLSCNVDNLTPQHCRYLGRLMPLIREENTIVSGPDLFSQSDYYPKNKAVNEVAHVKPYSAPHEVVEKYQLASFTLEYHRKYRTHSVLKSLTLILGGGDANRGIIDYGIQLCFCFPGLQLSATLVIYHYLNPYIPDVEAIRDQYRAQLNPNEPLDISEERCLDLDQEKNRNRFALATESRRELKKHKNLDIVVNFVGSKADLQEKSGDQFKCPPGQAPYILKWLWQKLTVTAEG